MEKINTKEALDKIDRIFANPFSGKEVFKNICHSLQDSYEIIELRECELEDKETENAVLRRALRDRCECDRAEHEKAGLHDIIPSVEADMEIYIGRAVAEIEAERNGGERL
jgi:hypothetical protein